MAPSLRPEHLLAAILSSTEDALLTFALDGTIQTWSQGAEELYGYREPEIRGQSFTVLLPEYELPAYEELLAAGQEQGIRGSAVCDRLHKRGSTMRVAVSRNAVLGRNGDVVAVVERARMLAPDGAANASLQNLLRQMPAVLWTTDRDLRITSNWGSGMQLARVGPGELIGQSVYEFLKCQDVHAASLAQHAMVLGGISSRFEYSQQNRDFEIRLEPLRNASGEIIGCIGAGIDITERKRCEEQARYQATHDALTGLANYREFLDTLEREVRRADRANHSFALLLLDMDDLKRINDRWGHLAGNRALRRLAGILRAQCRSTDLAARYGGDEFAVLLIDADPAMARQVAERVETALAKGQEQPAVRVSIGIGIYPDNGRTASELLEAADRNLYGRKRSSHGQTASAT